MLATPPFGASSNKALLRANIKPPVELVVADLEPLGLVVVDNGNHSVNAAIIYDEGEIIVNTVIDISEVLERYRFDGKKYVSVETNKIVNIENLKNNSEPFTYTFGLLFEMARVLKNAKDENGYVYYDVN